MYYSPIVDKYGFTHSVDMVIVDYFLKCTYTTASRLIVDLFKDIDGFDVDKNSSLGNLPNFKYQYYTDMIWTDGLVVHLGKYSDYDKISKEWLKLDMVRIKVNPNKHSKSIAFDLIKKFIAEYCADGYLVRWDYAIDIPVDINDVLVCGCRKERGLYKGTRYYGQRHKHGYLKIYDKAKEQRLDTPLTRLEYTFQAGLLPSWDNIVIRAPDSSVDAPDASRIDLRSARLYLDMLLEIKALGGDIEPYLERMNYRTVKKIEPYLYQGIQLEFDDVIHCELLNLINDTFMLTDLVHSVKPDSEFLDIDTNTIGLPFD